MLADTDLTRTLKPSGAKDRALRDRLAALHRACAAAGLPVMVAFEGWDAAGKGSVIHTLTEALDPRGVTVHPISAPRPFEQARPWLWRFWRKVPPRGAWALFDRSWYGRMLVGRIDRLVEEAAWERAYGETLQFERALADDGYVLVKVFLHIGKDEQLRRLHALLADPVSVWRVTPEDWQNHHRYDEWLGLYDEMLRRTDTEQTPWTIVPATCPAYTRRAVGRALIDAIEARLP